MSAIKSLSLLAYSDRPSTSFDSKDRPLVTRDLAVLLRRRIARLSGIYPALAWKTDFQPSKSLANYKRDALNADFMRTSVSKLTVSKTANQQNGV
jgi:hypothetical protein